MSPRTLYDKLWSQHLVAQREGEPALLYIDLHLVHEVTSPQAFDGLRHRGLAVRRPERTVATLDHSLPTHDRALPIADPIAANRSLRCGRTRAFSEFRSMRRGAGARASSMSSGRNWDSPNRA